MDSRPHHTRSTFGEGGLKRERAELNGHAPSYLFAGVGAWGYRSSSLLEAPVALTSKQVRTLRAAAHHLKPVILVGDKGVSAEVVQATRDALEAHELLKVKWTGADRDEVEDAADSLAVATEADVVQIIGKTIILFLQREKDSRFKL